MAWHLSGRQKLAISVGVVFALLGLLVQSSFDPVRRWAAVSDGTVRENAANPHDPDSAGPGEPSAGRGSGGAESRRNFAKLANQVLHDLDQALPLMHGKIARDALAAIRDSVTRWQRLLGEYLELASNGDFVDARTLITDRMAPLLAAVDRAARQLEAGQLAVRASGGSADNNVARSKWTYLALIFIALSCVILLVLVVQKVKRRLWRRPMG